MEISRANFERFPPDFELPEPWKGLPGISKEGIDWDQLGKAIETDDFMKFWRSIKYNRSNFLASLIVIHSVIETFVDELVKARCGESPKNHSTNLATLKRKGFLSHRSFVALNKLRRVRNRVAHEPVFEWRFIQDEFQNYPPIAAEFFYQWCLGVMGVLWNTNMDVLMPVFAPLGHRFKQGDQQVAPAGLPEPSDDR
jgi:hypothetical protein